MLENAGVIRGYTAVIDEEAYGLPVTALVRIRLQSMTTPPSPRSRRRSAAWMRCSIAMS
ncbi:hypothetical protein P0F65_20100 [Sphingomonas sp. I4]